jgi:ABC-type polysaccharide/polyol phosphate transport system ATPase subunit
MSSDLLISARAIHKAFPLFTAAPRLFWSTLFGAPAAATDSIEVLHGIDLDIRRGETVGVMGRNGAGKTTLLSILSGIAQPSSGTVVKHGKVAALLALTASFHPNLTGRKNAQLFCSLQGIHGAAQVDKVAQIEAFAGVGDYFDMPLRTYSSGMQARVAFAGAVHVDADVIVIDETLAVGDAAFRLKCYDRIRAMRSAGQTFLLVSHSPNLIANFCTRGVVLEKGRKVFDGTTPDAIEHYKKIRTELLDDETVQTRNVQLAGDQPAGNQAAASPAVALESIKADVPRSREEPLLIHAVLRALRDVENATINVGIRNHEGIVVSSVDGVRAGIQLPQMQSGQVIDLACRLDNRLSSGRYFVSLLVSVQVGDVNKPVGLFQNVLQLDVVRPASAHGGLVDLGLSVESNLRA